MATKCPWTGLPCDCESFPWLENGAIPERCEIDMPIEMATVRKVSPAFKARYIAYLVPCRSCKQRYEKIDGVKHGLCGWCSAAG